MLKAICMPGLSWSRYVRVICWAKQLPLLLAIFQPESGPIPHCFTVSGCAACRGCTAGLVGTAAPSWAMWQPVPSVP